MRMTNSELMTNDRMTKRSPHHSTLKLRHSFVIGHWSFVIPAVLGVMFSLATTKTALAIAGVDQPPPPSAPREVKFATPKETRLVNGLRVIVAERPGLPLLAAQIVVRKGSEAEPDALAGTASMTGTLLTKGTETMSAPEIA